MMLALLGGAALVVTAIAALALESWWILVVVMAVHALIAAVVVGFGLLKASESHDKPDPVTEARIEEEQAEEEGPRAGRVAKDREVFN